MSWRPEGWINPHSKWPVVENYTEQEVRLAARDSFEAGADVMLEALKAKGAKIKSVGPHLIIDTVRYAKGRVIFIPEETE